MSNPSSSSDERSFTPVKALPPGQLIRRLGQVYQAAWIEHVDPVVTPAQSAVLSAVREHPGSDQGSIGASVSIDRSTMANIVARLVSRGLLERSKSTTDGRRVLLFLTDAGSEVIEAVVIRAQKLDDLLLGDYGNRGQDLLLGVLSTLAADWEHIINYED